MRCNSRTWIVWSYPDGKPSADPIALPAMPQTGPRHRSHARLDFAGKAILVHLLEPATLPARDCELVGQCTPEIVALLAFSMRRAIASHEIEHRHVERRID